VVEQVGLEFVTRGYTKAVGEVTSFGRATGLFVKEVTNAAQKTEATSKKILDQIKVVRDATRATREYTNMLVQNARANQEVINSLTGVNREYKSAQQSASVFSSEIERLSMKYKPLYAAEMAHKKALEEINTANRLGILTDAQRADSIKSLNDSLRQSARHVNQVSQGLNKQGLVVQQAG